MAAEDVQRPTPGPAPSGVAQKAPTRERVGEDRCEQGVRVEGSFNSSKVILGQELSILVELVDAYALVVDSEPSMWTVQHYYLPSYITVISAVLCSPTS